MIGNKPDKGEPSNPQSNHDAPEFSPEYCLQLFEDNKRLRERLEEKLEIQIRCPVTKLYNGRYFADFLKETVEERLGAGDLEDLSVLFISVDNLARIKYLYGDREVDEVLKNIAYLLNERQGDAFQAFRLHGATFGVAYLYGNKEEAVSLAEDIRNQIAGFIGFIERITVSIGVVSLLEVVEDMEPPFDAAMNEMAQKRVGIAKSRGMNSVCHDSSLGKAEEAGLGKVLLVDVDHVNVSFLQHYLEDNNFSVLKAYDGVDALRLAQTEHPDVIISEIMLPKIDGLFLREKLLSDSATKNIAFILISHLKNEALVSRAASLAITHYFKKPYMIAEVIGILKNYRMREEQ